MKVGEIRDERDFYEAVREYTNKVWQWGAHLDEDYKIEPTPDELIEVLKNRVKWVEAHKVAVDTYLRKRRSPTWVRVIDGSKGDPERLDEN